MKKSIKSLITVLLAAIMALSAFACKKAADPEEYSRVVGEYDGTPLRGGFLTSGNDAYKVGKNSLGFPVFVSPDKAWEAFIVDYAEGIEMVKNKCNLKPISKEYYRPYIIGVQLATHPKGSNDDLYCDVAYFIDLYENSFPEAYTGDPYGMPL